MPQMVSSQAFQGLAMKGNLSAQDVGSFYDATARRRQIVDIKAVEGLCKEANLAPKMAEVVMIRQLEGRKW